MSTLVLAIVLFLSLIPSAGVAQCVGDCSGDGVISINELIVGVNIALGNSPSSACPAFAGGGPVTIDRLIAAVNGALNGCTPPPTDTPASPAPTPTPTATIDAVGLVDLEPAYGVPDADIDISVRFTRSVPLGSLLLELRVTGNPFDAVRGCRLEITQGVTVSADLDGGVVRLSVPTLAQPVTISAADRLTCVLHIAASTRAGPQVATLSGTITPPTGAPLAVAASDAVTIQCVTSASCDTAEVCDNGKCVAASATDTPSPSTPTVPAGETPTARATPTATVPSSSTSTPTHTSTRTPTSTVVPTSTVTPTATRTVMVTVTRTQTTTVTATPTVAATITTTRTLTATPTRTATATQTGTATSAGTPTPTINLGIIDIGAAFGVPNANTSVAVEFNTAFSIGSIQMQYSFADDIMDNIGDCFFDITNDVVIVTGNGGGHFSVTVTPQTGTVLIPAGDQLRCDFHVAASAKAGSHPSSLSGTITLPDAQTIPFASSGQVNLTCTLDEHCNAGQVCNFGTCGAP